MNDNERKVMGVLIIGFFMLSAIGLAAAQPFEEGPPEEEEGPKDTTTTTTIILATTTTTTTIIDIPPIEEGPPEEEEGPKDTTTTTLPGDQMDCEQGCMGQGYSGGYCNTYPIVPEVQICSVGEYSIGPIGSCTMPPEIVDAAKTCCCTEAQTTTTTLPDIPLPEYPTPYLPVFAALLIVSAVAIIYKRG